MAKLFHLVLPDVAVFGQKDAQQALIIDRLTRQLNMPIRIVSAPISREDDGLARSSRNGYLSQDERTRATGIIESLRLGVDELASGERNAGRITARVRERMASHDLEIEYVEALALPDLSTLDVLQGRVILAVAARIGETRLIDNIIVEIERDGSVGEAPLL